MGTLLVGRGNKGDANDTRAVATHRKARHKYNVVETFEAGIVLAGGEVKSLRAGRASLEGSFARPRRGELYLLEAQIMPYTHAGPVVLDPRRPRKLLLKRREIRRLSARVEQRGFTLVPLKIYFRRGWAKVELALCTGKTFGDKREAVKAAEAKRHLARARLQKRR